ncbi:hypothetical protein EAXG_01502 [Escherichia coli TA054]|nr:hypothetical protein EAXG_01502 [Escherichia coli TA054]
MELFFSGFQLFSMVTQLEQKLLSEHKIFRY